MKSRHLGRVGVGAALLVPVAAMTVIGASSASAFSPNKITFVASHSTLTIKIGSNLTVPVNLSTGTDSCSDTAGVLSAAAPSGGTTASNCGYSVSSTGQANVTIPSSLIYINGYSTPLGTTANVKDLFMGDGVGTGIITAAITNASYSGCILKGIANGANGYTEFGPTAGSAPFTNNVNPVAGYKVTPSITNPNSAACSSSKTSALQAQINLGVTITGSIQATLG